MPSFRCSKCGHRSTTFRSMGKHARTHKFPRGVHRGRKGEVHLTKTEVAKGFPHFCPLCGRRCG